MKKQLNLENLTADPLRGGAMPFNMTVNEYVDFWLNNYKKSIVKPSTYTRLCWSYEAMKDYPIGQMCIKDVTLMDIQVYVNQVTNQGYSGSSIKKMARIITSPLKFAAANHWISSDPGVGIMFPNKNHIKAEERDVEAYDLEDQKKINIELDTYKYAGYTVIRMVLEEGMRPGEVLALNWGDIDFRRNSIVISKTISRSRSMSAVQNGAKTKTSNRTIPITPAVKKMLFDIYQVRQPSKDDPIFIDSEGKRISYNSLRYTAKRLCEAAHVKYKGVHVYRHTFATNCYYKGIDIKILSRMLGHASVQITYDTYINLYGDGFNDLNNVFGA